MSGWVTVDKEDTGDKGCILGEAFWHLGEAMILAFRAWSFSHYQWWQFSPEVF